MKDLGKLGIVLAYGFGCLLFGAANQQIVYNKPISGIQLRIINDICKKNDGLDWVKRDWWRANEFIIKCKDTATFESVTFNLVEKDQG